MTQESTNKKRILSDILVLAGGTGIAQIVSITVTPILSRIYYPSDFGTFALFASITGILSVISCLRYEMSIMLPESEKEANDQLILSILLSLFFSTFIGITLYFFKNLILRLLNIEYLGSYLYLVPFLIFLEGIFMALNYWNSRKKKFRVISKAKVSGSLSQATVNVSAGYLGYVSGISLIYGYLFGKIISTLILLYTVSKNYGERGEISSKSLYKGLIKYKKFLLIDTWSSLLNSFSWQFPVLLLSMFFTPTVVGFYSLGFRLLQMPMNFIGRSITQVFYQRATETKKEGGLNKLVENMFRYMVIIGMFPIMILTFSGEAIFGVILGTEWTEAGVYVQILSVWGFIWFISTPLSTLYVIFEKQEFGLKYNIFNFFTRILSFLIGGYLGNVYVALGLFSISGIFVYGYLCLKMLNYAGVKNSNIYLILLSNLKLFIPAGFVLITLKIINDNPYIVTSAAILLCIAYYLYVIKTDSQFQSMMRIIIKVPTSLKNG